MDDVRRVLETKASELRAQLDQLAAPSGDTADISFGKRVGDGTALAVERLSQVAAHERLLALLTDVQRAQQKVDDGTYGSCDGCGEQIAPARLEALPWAVRCVQCAGRVTRR